jgi:NAD(P)H dehydrogenase (quinone)
VRRRSCFQTEKDKKMKIGVTGSSGRLGAATLKHLLSRISASDLVAITRYPEKIKDLSGQDVEVRYGDFDDRRSLLSAFRGLDRLLLIPASDLRTGVRRAQHLAAVDAIEECAVGQVLYVSDVGARPDGKDTLFESHFVTEQALIRAGVPWTFLRASLYAEVLLDAAKRARATGVYAAPAGALVGYAARDDIAGAAAGILTSSGHEGKTYHATGPQAVSNSDVAEAISAASGKTVRYKEISNDEYKEQLDADNLPPVLIDVLLDIQATIRAGVFDLVSGDIARLAGKRPESVSNFLKRHQAGRAAGA